MQSFALRGAALGAFAVALPLTVCAATTLGTQDSMFVMKAAQAGMTEVKLAAVAMQKSKNPHVISFAREMKMDHAKANAQLASIVKAKGLLPPSSVGAKNEAAMAKLQAQSGAMFDASYLKSQLPAHQEVLALFKAEVTSGKDSDLVAFAKQTIPVIESHISMDKRDIAQVDSVGMQMPVSK